MGNRSQLLTEFMMQAPIQPATNYWRAVEMEEVIRHGVPSGIGLDLGCGDGHLMSILMGHVGSRQLVGLDSDSREVLIASGRRIYSQVVTGSADRLPFGNGGFDFVFSNSVLEHIENIDGALEEVARVLRPKGRFLFTVPGPDFHACLQGPLFGEREAYLRETDARCAHLRYWPLEEWKRHLEVVGLTTIHHHGYLTRDQVRRWEFIARMTSGVLYRLARRKRQPIELQRCLNIRTPVLKLPRVFARSIATAIEYGSNATLPLCGCLLIEARRDCEFESTN
jgi:SAM-dependent methyltransferase